MYADSSFLVSLYMLDANSVTASTLARSLPEPLVYSALHRLEVSNAFALAMFRSIRTRQQTNNSRAQLEADLRAQILLPTAISWPDIFKRAAQIACTETPTLGTRSLDILHVACAEKLGAKEFLTFDRRQGRLAAKLGMQVRP